MPRRLFLSLLSCSIIGAFSFLSYAQDALQQKLSELDKIRGKKNIPYDEVEKRGKELLAEYTAPEDQGRIYYELTQIHGQTGMVHADLVVQHAQKALTLAVDPFQRFRLYVYWGVSIFIGNIHKPREQQKPLYEVRRVAVRPYLEGLKEMQKYEIPEKLPDLPGGGVRYDDIKEDSPEYKQFKKMNEDHMAAWMEAQFDRKLWFSHQTLMNGVIDLYSRPPFAATELRQLATKILDDPEKVDALMKRIEAKGALKDDPIPEKANAKNPG